VHPCMTKGPETLAPFFIFGVTIEPRLKLQENISYEVGANITSVTSG